MEDWVTIKNLKAKNPEISNREIARKLGVSHNTVKLALERPTSPKYNSSGRVSSLEPLKDEILKMLNVMKLNGSRIYDELCSRGYTGGRTTFYDFLSKINPSETKHFTPYETAPGEQSQFDRRVLTLFLSEVISPISTSTATSSHLAVIRSLRFLYHRTSLQSLKHLKTALLNLVVHVRDFRQIMPSHLL